MIKLVSRVENMEIAGGSSAFGFNKYSESRFLRRVLTEELGDHFCPIKLMVIGVHAVLLESGFVRCDSVGRIQVGRFQFPEKWNSNYLKLSVCYTLPAFENNPNLIEKIELRFQPMSHNLNVYGSLADINSGHYHLCLEGKFSASLIFLMNNDDYNGVHDHEVYEFWKIVKDTLVFPLLIDLCQKASLVLPPCFVSLPPELKMKILEFLPGADIARLACVCKELRHLCDNEELWKNKYAEEIGILGNVKMLTWKGEFAMIWEKKKAMNKGIWSMNEESPSFPFQIRTPPFICGLPSPYRQPGDGNHFPSFWRHANFAHYCHFGGSFQ